MKAEKGYDDAGEGSKSGEEGFQAPGQLKPSYVVVPAKLRLVEFNAIPKRALVRQTASPKIIVSFSCSNLVDFHFQLFSCLLGDSLGTEPPKPTPKPMKPPKSPGKDPENPHAPEIKPDPSGKPAKRPPPNNPVIAKAPHLHPTVLLHKLHGSFPQAIRTAILHSFAHTTCPSLLFCPDVAARGLRLRNVDLITQFDPLFSHEDHIHRIGRTGRAGHAR